jgi:hypothetical protein
MADRLPEADMNENENNFEALRRLLALKRHEVPPPGYFEHFSGGVIARIRAGESGAQNDLQERLPWLFRLIQLFEAKPAFAGVFASALCLLLLAGIVNAERPDVPVQPFMLPTANAASLNVASASVPGLNTAPAFPVGLISSSNSFFNPQPMSSPQTVLLFGGQNALAQPVNFTLPGN